jgi:hypothetical protein
MSLLTVYNNELKQLITIYNTNVAAILNLRIRNNIKQTYLNNLKAKFQADSAKLKAKYQADLAALIPIPTVVPAALIPTVVPAALVPAPLIPTVLVPVKRAVLIGINYTGTDSQLSGCINDTNGLKTILTSKYAFAETNIKVLTDDTPTKPTRENILAAFTQLLQSGIAGDVLFFSYSGHGSYTADLNHDETSGNDEMIVPLDLKIILDDELKALVQTHLKKNVTLFALFDSCHSGTVLDLKYQYLDSLHNNANTQNNQDAETIGTVIMLSGCTDEQTSADAHIDKKYQGAMTWAFLAALNGGTGANSWQDLLTKMRTQLKNSAFTQIPQLSSGCVLDLNSALCF